MKPGDTIAIVGAGPVGMSILLTAQFYSPGRIIMIDMDPPALRLRGSSARPIPSRWARRMPSPGFWK